MPDVEFDPCVIFPEFAQLRAAVAEDDWAAIAAYAAAWRDRDPSRLYDATWQVVGAANAEAFLAEHAGEPLARALRAALRIDQGWEIRTGARADNVSEEQWRGFRAKLVDAEQDLIELAAVDPSDTLTATLRLITSRGLGLGLSECQRRYARVGAVAPSNVAAQRAHLQDLAPKWYGDTDRMFEFARRCWREAPAGDSSGTLVAHAQLEQWLELGDAEGIAFLKASAQADELRAAALASVFHEDYEAGVGWVQDHSIFAVVHSLGERHGDAARHFQQLGGVAHEGSWKYFHDPAKAYADHRINALGK